MAEKIIVPGGPVRDYPRTADVLAATPRPTGLERARLGERVKRLLAERDAVLVAHYYTDPDLQQLAEVTGGRVADSLEMARFGHAHPATTLVVAGVRFMGETAKILSPEKRVLMPTLEADCSLDLSCPAEEFSAFCDAHPERTPVVYANTSAAVKARADWVVTSSIAVDVVRHLREQGERLIWAPDRYLGGYIQRVTGADMLVWQGSCVVHEEFSADGLAGLKALHPEAAVLVHPESPEGVVALAEVVGSTSQLVDAAARLPNPTLIVATDNGIFYRMRQAAPGKRILEAPTSEACVSCAHCPWMAMNGLQNLARVLETGENEVQVDEEVRRGALRATRRMIEFAASRAKAAGR